MKSVARVFPCRVCNAQGFCEREALADRRRAAQERHAHNIESREAVSLTISMAIMLPQLLAGVPSITVFLCSTFVPIVAAVISSRREVWEINKMFKEENALFKRCNQKD